MARALAPAGLLFAVLLAHSVVLAAPGISSWPSSGHDGELTRANLDESSISAGNAAHMYPAWTVAASGIAVAGPTRIYVGGTSGVRVLDSRTGRTLHLFAPRSLRLRTGDRITDLVLAGTRLFVASTAGVIALNPDNGVIFWRTHMAASTLTPDNQTLYTAYRCSSCSGTAGVSYAVSMSSGRILWKHAAGNTTAAALVGGHLYQSQLDDGRSAVYDPASGRLLATLPVVGAWTGSSTAVYMYHSSDRPWLAQIGPTGKPVWRVALGKAVGNTAPALAYHTVYVPSDRFHPGIVAVNVANGHIRWAADLTRPVQMAVANHLLFVLETRPGVVQIFNADSGRSITRVIVPRFAAGASAGIMVAGGASYVTDGTRLTALRP